MKYARLVRGGKFFRLADLLVYGAAVLLIAALFLAAALIGGGQAEGFRVEVNGETVYTYRFGAGGEVSSEWADRVTEREEEGLLLVTVQVSEGEWNEIVIDDGAKSASMRDANCSRRKDCCAMQPVGEGGGVIVCIPHGLRILPLSEEDFSRPSVG